MTSNLAQLDTSSRKLSTVLIGFDQLFDDIEHDLVKSTGSNYPPCNILKHSDSKYEVELAITGLDSSQVSVAVELNTITIIGKPIESKRDVQYIHRGLATRDFIRQFAMAEHFEVCSATIKNGLLSIIMVHNKPKIQSRMIDIVEIK